MQDSCEKIDKLSSHHGKDIYQMASEVLVPVWSEKDYLYFLERTDYYNVGLFLSGQLSCGFLSLKLENELDVVAIVCRKEHQKRGLATKLMNHVMLQSDWSRIRLEVDLTNEAAVKLYLKCGFQVVGTRKRYYEGKRDAWLMTWERTKSIS